MVGVIGAAADLQQLWLQTFQGEVDRALFPHARPLSYTLTSTGTRVSAGCSCYTTGSSIPGKMPARGCAGAGGALRPHVLHREQAEEQAWHPATSLLPRPQATALCWKEVA